VIVIQGWNGDRDWVTSDGMGIGTNLDGDWGRIQNMRDGWGWG